MGATGLVFSCPVGLAGVVGAADVASTGGTTEETGTVVSCFITVEFSLGASGAVVVASCLALAAVGLLTARGSVGTWGRTGTTGKGTTGKGTVGKGTAGKGTAGKGTAGKGTAGKGTAGKGTAGKGTAGVGCGTVAGCVVGTDCGTGVAGGSEATGVSVNPAVTDSNKASVVFGVLRGSKVSGASDGGEGSVFGGFIETICLLRRRVRPGKGLSGADNQGSTPG